MGAEGRQLAAHVGPHVDSVGYLGARGPCGGERRRIEAARGQPRAGGERNRAGDRLTGQGGLEKEGRAACEGCSLTGHSVHLEVVGMAVAAGGVVSDDDVGLDLVQDPADAIGHGEGVLVCEPEGVLCVEPRVGIAQRLDAIDAEGIGGGGELSAATQREVARELG